MESGRNGCSPTDEPRAVRVIMVSAAVVAVVVGIWAAHAEVK